MRASGDDDVADALRAEVLGGELAHLAGTDDQHAAAVELTEDLAGEPHGGKAHGDGTLAEGRFGAHALADRKRRREELVQKGTRAAPLGGDAERVLDLSQHLGLADHQRVKAGSHPEQVVRHLIVLTGEQMRHELVGRQLVILGEEPHQFLPGLRDVLAGDIQLRPVAGREHHGLGRTGPCAERLHRGADVAAGEVQPFPQFHGGRAMTDAEKKEVHARPRSCGTW